MSKFKPGDQATTQHCREQIQVDVIVEVEDSAGLARDPLFRVTDGQGTFLRRASELRESK